VSDSTLISFSKRPPIHIGKVEATSMLDAVNVSQFGEELDGFVQAHDKANLLLDFEGVQYLSSAVLSELLNAQERCEATGGGLRLCSVNPEIKKVFEISNLDSVFVLYDCGAGVAVKRYQKSLDIAQDDETWGHATERL
jgi:anti-sigma B factor antagonist